MKKLANLDWEKGLLNKKLFGFILDKHMTNYLFH